MLLGLGSPQTPDCCSSSMGSLDYPHQLLGETAHTLIRVGSTTEMPPTQGDFVLGRT